MVLTTQDSLFTRGLGLGSQLMLRSSAAGQTTQLGLVAEQIRRLVVDHNEAAAIIRHVTDYVSGHVTVEALVKALSQTAISNKKVLWFLSSLSII